uniref:Integrase catalytic domain-containing protein n=1 Tax=Amphimedon queenslandica TaxID=400682 RepID=A0A1X7UX27_AMPQE
MRLTELPETPWQKVMIDLFEFNHLKLIFAHHGIPQTVVFDNGPQLSSDLFSQFAKQPHFNQITSSPRYAQANGEAKRVVQTVKGLLRCSDDHYTALVAYRATPLKLWYSSAELLMGKRLWTTVPVSLELLKPNIPNRKQVRKNHKELKETQKNNYNTRHRISEQAILGPGDSVWITD